MSSKLDAKLLFKLLIFLCTDLMESRFLFSLLRPSPLIFMFLIDMVRQSRVGRSAKKKAKKNVGHNVQRHEIKAYKVQVYQELIQYLL